jgi:alkylated DNA nucleotide flippase Atl1
VATAAPPPPNAAPWPDDHEPTPFQQAVVEAVASLGPGDVVTYGELAAEIGRPGSAQAVANVLRGVPELPWWRVVPSEGRLYRSHARVQRRLLEAEGIRIVDRRVVVEEETRGS